MFRLRHTSVSEFPRCGSISACRALRPIPPSSNPACGFPALGFPENSRPGHTQGVARFRRSQVHQPQIHKVIANPLPFRRPKGPLAPSFKMRYQTKCQETVDLSERLAWVPVVEVVAPSYQMPVNFSASRSAHAACPALGQGISPTGTR